MKKILIILLTLFLLIFQTACRQGTADADQSTGGENLTDEFSFETPLEMQLMLGTVKLEETEYPIDAEQASELLPLWKALRSLISSETAAQAEVDAVISQIQETMTDEQMKTIEEMALIMADFAAVAETLGIETGFGGRLGDISPEMQATMEARRDSGEFQGPGGGFGPGEGFGPGGGQGPGGGFLGGAEMDPAARQTAIAERGGVRGAGFGINSALLNGIIEFLEAKIQ